jgi:hypothetical protein
MPGCSLEKSRVNDGEEAATSTMREKPMELVVIFSRTNVRRARIRRRFSSRMQGQNQRA